VQPVSGGWRIVLCFFVGLHSGIHPVAILRLIAFCCSCLCYNCAVPNFYHAFDHYGDAGIYCSVLLCGVDGATFGTGLVATPVGYHCLSIVFILLIWKNFLLVTWAFAELRCAILGTVETMEVLVGDAVPLLQYILTCCSVQHSTDMLMSTTCFLGAGTTLLLWWALRVSNLLFCGDLLLFF